MNTMQSGELEQVPTEAHSRVRSNRGLGREIIRHRVLLMMLLPAVIYYLIFRYGPVFGIIIGFQDFRPRVGQGFVESILSSEWVGLVHFKEFFTSLYGVQILRNTIAISFLKLFFGFPAPIILALMLNEVIHIGFKKIVQTISYLPHFISWVILGGILRVVLSPDFGVAVPVFEFFGMRPINFVGDPRYFRGLLVASAIWQGAGFGSIIYLAALSGIDPQLYEAATIDGAGRIRQLMHITLPGIASTIVILLILRTGSILKAGFDQVFNLYNPAVYSVAEIIDTYVYRVGLLQTRFSYSTAIGLFQSFVGLSMVIFTNFIARRLGREGIW